MQIYGIAGGFFNNIQNHSRRRGSIWRKNFGGRFCSVCLAIASIKHRKSQKIANEKTKHVFLVYLHSIRLKRNQTRNPEECMSVWKWMASNKWMETVHERTERIYHFGNLNWVIKLTEVIINDKKNHPHWITSWIFNFSLSRCYYFFAADQWIFQRNIWCQWPKTSILMTLQAVQKCGMSAATS